MPYLRIQTNHAVDETKKQRLLPKASAMVARELGKPESYVMVALAPPEPMLFAGTDTACAYMELKSIGLPQSQTKDLSRALCQLLQEEIDIPAERIYIEFADAERAMWGWDKSTF